MIHIAGSKSISNRLLILQQLYPGLKIQNISDAEDTLMLKKALSSTSNIIDIHHAGTAMRFLTAYFATRDDREVVLTGSSRMKQRPIGELVNALQQLGSSIDYLEKDGYPPLKITGKKIVSSKVTINSGVSSQFITALLLIAPSLENGLEITLKGNKTSQAYLQMTISLLTELGVVVSVSENTILIKPFMEDPKKIQFKVESDWSTASYFYSLISLSPIGTNLKLQNFETHSLQGDAIITEHFQQLGVKTTYLNGAISLTKNGTPTIKELNLNLNNSPDLAQTLVVCCLGLQIPFHFNGLQTLKIKETDRLVALKNELAKLGVEVSIDKNSISSGAVKNIQLPKVPVPEIATYNDHRMAMAFAPLALLMPIKIKDAEVVVKSCPLYWEYLSKLGVNISEY